MEKLIECKICKNTSQNIPFFAREMMFGLRDEFVYFECSSCGCVQIKDIPLNISDYYPDDYYSYVQGNNSFLRLFFKYQLLRYRYNKVNIIGRIVSVKYKHLYIWINKNIFNYKSKILDVGCGSGRLLLSLNKIGFTNLTGIDPYIKSDIFYNCGVNVYKKELQHVSEQYDFIMLHHSFEHMENPSLILKELFRLLKPKSHLLIRIPIVSSFAWRKYKASWFQLDPPRHLFLHSVKSMQILSEEVGMTIKNIEYDSDENQFCGSEMYLRNIPYNNPIIFPTKTVKHFYKEAVHLNKINDGDSACFYLYKD